MADFDDDFDSLPVRIRGSTSSTIDDSQIIANSPQKINQQNSYDELSRPSRGVTFNLDSEVHSLSQSRTMNDSQGTTADGDNSVFDSNEMYNRDQSTFDESAIGENEEFLPAEKGFLDNLDFLEGRGGDDQLASERQAALARQSLYTRFDPLVSNPAEAARSRLSELNRREDPFVQSGDPSVDLSSLALSDNRGESLEQSPAKSETSRNSSSVYSPPHREHTKVQSRLSSETKKISNGVKGNDLIEPLLYTQSDLDSVTRSAVSERDRKIEELEAKLKNQLAEQNVKHDVFRKENNEMKKIVGEYEKTIIELTENSQRSTMMKEESLSELLKDKEQLRIDLNSAESSILEAYKRVETLKQAVEDYKSNETQLKIVVEDYKEKLKRSEERYQNLKKHAEEKLELANKEISKVRKSKEVDKAGLEAAVKKGDARNASLEQSLTQKIAENEELTKICDDLINRISDK